MSNLTLIADAADVGAAVGPTPAADYRVRPSRPTDADRLGALYFGSYEAGEASSSLAEAIADVRASFAGEYGDYLFDASPIVEHGSEIVAAVMTVARAPWDDTPDCPFVIELFTDRRHRRRGLAADLVRRAASSLGPGDTSIALRVAADNTAALALYERLGFRRWEPGHGTRTDTGTGTVR